MSNPRFYFAVSQVGAEKVLKDEIAHEFRNLRFAFSRPGFITFKDADDSGAPVIPNTSVFTRLWGVSIGQAKDQNALIDLLSALPDRALVHAFERDQYVPGDEPEGFTLDARIIALVQSLPDPVRNKFVWNAPPKPGQEVFDLIWIDENHTFLGSHTHESFLDPAPGNRPVIVLSEKSPSRAYLKIAEAMHRFRPAFQKGEQVLEVGCAPGGASIALLEQGLAVIGVDPKQVDERLYRERGFDFIQKMAKNVTPFDLKEINPAWLVMDMNIAPLEALDELAHVVSILRRNHGNRLKLRCGLLTIKLNDWKFASSISLYLKRLEEIGFSELSPMQLCSNRQEFFVMAKSFR